MLGNRAIETEDNCESGSRKSGLARRLSPHRGRDAPLTCTLFLHEPCFFIRVDLRGFVDGLLFSRFTHYVSRFIFLYLQWHLYNP